MAGQGGLAEQVRVGLVSSSHKRQNAKQDPLLELWYGKPVRQHIWEFACVIGIVAILISISILRKQHNTAWPFALCTLTFLLLCIARYKALWLKPVWRAFVDLGTFLGMLMTPVVLGIVWFIAFIPLAILLKAIGIRTMETRFREERNSYWDDRDAKYDNPELLKRQF